MKQCDGIFQIQAAKRKGGRTQERMDEMSEEMEMEMEVTQRKSFEENAQSDITASKQASALQLQLQHPTNRNTTLHEKI